VQGIETKILFEGAFLSPWTFKNVVRLGLRLQKYDWTEHFIQQHSPQLEEKFRIDALHYNLADLYYYTNRFEAAMTQLQQVEFTDIHYNLDSKEMLAKIYYERNETEALRALLSAFQIFLKRNTIISDTVRQTYLNFIHVLQLLIKNDKKKAAKLKENIQTLPQLAARKWLLEQYEKIAFCL
jgi:hypothetical protein